MKILLLLIMIFLAGCSGSGYRHANVDFVPTGPQQPDYPSGLTSTFKVEDKRDLKEVVRYLNHKSGPVVVDAEPPLTIVLEDRLGAGFRQQGLNISRASAVHIVVKINTLQAVVRKNKVLNQVTAETDLSLLVNTPQKSLTKKYTRSADKQSLTSPDLTVIEQMLREQLREISEIILADSEIRSTIITGTDIDQ